jgi:RNA polymerase sigma-70 factor (ECF subfamily)
VEERELIKRLKKGLPEAQEEFVCIYQVQVANFLRRLLRDDDLAAEITQQTMILACRKLQTFRQVSSLKTWLYRIAINQSGSHWRQVKRRGEVDFETSCAEITTDSPMKDIINKQKGEKLRQAIESLPSKQRLALTLRFYEGLSFKEVAKSMGGTLNSAKVNHYHALRRLRELLGDKKDEL